MTDKEFFEQQRSDNKIIAKVLYCGAILWIALFVISHTYTTNQDGYSRFCTNVKGMPFGGMFIEMALQNTDSIGVGNINPWYAGKKVALKSCLSY